MRKSTDGPLIFSACMGAASMTTGILTTVLQPNRHMAGVESLILLPVAIALFLIDVGLLFGIVGAWLTVWGGLHLLHVVLPLGLQRLKAYACFGAGVFVANEVAPASSKVYLLDFAPLALMQGLVGEEPGSFAVSASIAGSFPQLPAAVVATAILVAFTIPALFLLLRRGWKQDESDWPWFCRLHQRHVRPVLPAAIMILTIGLGAYQLVSIGSPPDESPATGRSFAGYRWGLELMERDFRPGMGRIQTFSIPGVWVGHRVLTVLNESCGIIPGEPVRVGFSEVIVPLWVPRRLNASFVSLFRDCNLQFRRQRIGDGGQMWIEPRPWQAPAVTASSGPGALAAGHFVDLGLGQAQIFIKKLAGMHVQRLRDLADDYESGSILTALKLRDLRLGPPDIEAKLFLAETTARAKEPHAHPKCFD